MATLSLVALLGCSPADELAAGDEHLVDIDPAFTVEERLELDTCASEWRTFSSSRVVVVFRPGGRDFRVDRSGPSQGGYVRSERRAWIDAERLYADGFDARTGVRAMCMNLVGQFFGVELHGERGALSRDDVVPFFTEADRNACNASGVCS